MSTSGQQLGITLLRMSLGFMWVAHSLLKLVVFTLPGTAKFFDSVGFPGFLAYPVFAMELIGGICLIAGVYARQISLLLVPIMICAATVHFHNGWVFTSPGGGWEYPIYLAVASVAQWLIGDGAYTVARSLRFTLDPGSDAMAFDKRLVVSG
jgi:putative oxidoreductase